MHCEHGSRRGIVCLMMSLQVSRAGFYAWQARPPASRARADERLGLGIAAIRAATRQRYGSPRIHAELGGARVPDGSQARGAAHAGARAGRPSARGCSSGSVNRKRWQLNPGVYQTGASPLRLAATLYRDMGMTYRAHEAERPPRAAKARGSPM